MAIRINTNIASLNSQRNLERSNVLLNKTLERLSSGLRINRAADDAAGLAVSEKMRTQIRGFTQAIANAQDAGNLIATAESGLDQTSQILQRIRELSIQSASDTLVNSDRKKIQQEVNQLLDELDKIAETTEFNTRPLLDGSLQQATAQEDAAFAIKANARVGAFGADPSNPTVGDFLTIDTATNDGINVNTANFAIAQDAAYTFTILQHDGVTDFTSTDGVSDIAAGTAGDFVLEVRTSLGSGAVAYVDLGDGTAANSTQANIDIAALFTTDTNSDVINLMDHGGTNQALTVSFNVFNGTGVDLTDADIGKTSTVQLTASREAIVQDDALTFHVGANEGQYLKMGVQDMRANALRVEGLSLVGADDKDSRLKAQNAIGVVDQALDYVNDVRSRLGAYQNRIEYRVSNLQVSRENLSASESRIRDADIAAETANLTRAQILVQAGTAVLTQANISPQSALNLL